MSQLRKRWNGKTPEFWKKIQKVAIVAGALAATLLAAPVTLPAAVVAAAGYVITAGTVAATLSQFTVEDTETINNDQK